jgi:amidohydrolase
MIPTQDLVALRHRLHSRPELSGREAETARRMAAFIEPLGPDLMVSGLGGHGLAAVFDGPAPGPTVMLRAELDAVPVAESGAHDHRSRVPGVGHQCGHDGHMAILAGLAGRLARRRPARGRAVLLFQPSEETGAGAAAVLEDPRFAPLVPDWAFALHNLPGHAPGSVILRPGPFFCASRGLRIRFTGRDSHAAHPEQGRNPAAALARTVQALLQLPESAPMRAGFSLVTIVHMALGKQAFGVSPGRGQLWATLRAETDDLMDGLADAAVQAAAAIAVQERLTHHVDWDDVFAATVNDAEACQWIRRAARQLGAETVSIDRPFRVSEDFGRFAQASRAAIFGLGAGVDHPALHSAGYDFPDPLIESGTGLFTNLVTAICGRTG